MAKGNFALRIAGMELASEPTRSKQLLVNAEERTSLPASLWKAIKQKALVMPAWGFHNTSNPGAMLGGIIERVLYQFK